MYTVQIRQEKLVGKKTSKKTEKTANRKQGEEYDEFVAGAEAVGGSFQDSFFSRGFFFFFCVCEFSVLVGYQCEFIFVHARSYQMTVDTGVGR